jgi:hypothetical protein
MRELDHGMCFGEAILHVLAESFDLTVELFVNMLDCFGNCVEPPVETLNGDIAMTARLDMRGVVLLPHFFQQPLQFVVHFEDVTSDSNESVE